LRFSSFSDCSLTPAYKILQCISCRTDCADIMGLPVHIHVDWHESANITENHKAYRIQLYEMYHCDNIFMYNFSTCLNSIVVTDSTSWRNCRSLQTKLKTKFPRTKHI
jgi:hypothetical protein